MIPTIDYGGRVCAVKWASLQTIALECGNFGTTGQTIVHFHLAPTCPGCVAALAARESARSVGKTTT